MPIALDNTTDPRQAAGEVGGWQVDPDSKTSLIRVAKAAGTRSPGFAQPLRADQRHTGVALRTRQLLFPCTSR